MTPFLRRVMALREAEQAAALMVARSSALPNAQSREEARPAREAVAPAPVDADKVARLQAALGTGLGVGAAAKAAGISRTTAQRILAHASTCACGRRKHALQQKCSMCRNAARNEAMERLRGLLDAGVGTQDAAKRLGLSRSAVYRLAMRLQS